jgi:hypothetical protein
MVEPFVRVRHSSCAVGFDLALKPCDLKFAERDRKRIQEQRRQNPPPKA